MQIVKLVLLALAVGFPFSVSHAHHAFVGVFDMKSTIEVNGKVVKLELSNPHTNLYLQVTNEQGEIEDWVLEGPGKLSLSRRGWTDDVFEEGEIITVHGNPSLKGTKTMWLDRVIKADGTELVDPLIADDIAIEEERRARLLKAQAEN
jgi:hypothetical protein